MSLLVPAKKRCSADLTNRSANQRPQLFWDYLKQHKLVEKAMQSPFASLFYLAKEKTIPHLLVHQLLLREVDTSLPNELHVLLGSTICHFGRREFGLLTGLRFDGDDIPIDFEKRIGPGSFVDRVFHGLPNVKVSMIFNALSGNHSEDDLWRLCLCYLIEGIVYGLDDSNVVWRGMLYLVEDLSHFFEYPWGQRIFEVTMSFIRKADVPRRYLGKRKRKRPKYTIHGAVQILAYWALEAVPLLSTEDFVTKTAFLGFPRLQRWKITSSPKFKNLSTIFDRKKLECRESLVPCDKEEKDYVDLYQLDVIVDSSHYIAQAHDGGRRPIDCDIRLSRRGSDTDDSFDGHSDHFVDSKRHDVRGRRKVLDVGPSHVPADSSYARLEDRVSNCEKTQKRLDICMIELERKIQECIQKTDESMRMSDESLRLVREMHSMFQHFTNATTKPPIGTYANVTQPQYSFSAHDCGTEGLVHQDSRLANLGHQSECDFQTSDLILNQAQHYSSTTQSEHMPMMEHNFLTPIDGKAPQTSEYMQAMARMMNTTENAGHIQHPVSPLPFNLGVADHSLDPIGEYMLSIPSDDGLPDVSSYPKRFDMPIPPHPDKLDIMDYVFNVVEEKEHRLAKKDKWLDDYTDPCVKRPLLRYEVFRRLDFAKYESLYKWFKLANEQKTGKVVDDDGVEEGWGFFAVLLKRTAWLHWMHIDAGLRLYRERMKEHPGAYRPNTIICKCYFLTLLLRSASERYKKNHKWSKCLIHAIQGTGGLCKTPWTASSTILTIWNVQRSHWVTISISIPGWCISVFDSSFHVVDEIEMMKKLHELCVALPLVMHVSGSFDELPAMKQDPVPPFKVNLVKDVKLVPQSQTSGDCGIYALKYVEHLITWDNNFENIIDKNMSYFRLRLAMDIFHQNKLS